MRLVEGIILVALVAGVVYAIIMAIAKIVTSRSGLTRAQRRATLSENHDLRLIALQARSLGASTDPNARMVALNAEQVLSDITNRELEQ